MKDQSRIGIIGLGLIGGSIARALKARKHGYFITAWDKDNNVLDDAMRLGVIDRQTTVLSTGFEDCSLLILAIPVYAIKPVLQEVLPRLSKDCIITDVGSTKGDVVSLINGMELENRFIGGHPLAGSEKSGFASSKSNLFENAYYVITPTAATSEEAMDTLKQMVLDVGAIPITMSPKEHDHVTAAISHVPHVMASLLVNMVSDLDNPKNYMKTVAAGGFKDITRIASSSPDLWTGICLSNRQTVLETIDYIDNSLKKFAKHLENGNKEEVFKFFENARLVRSALSERPSLIQKTYGILVDVEDKPGIIAVIASALAKENINIKNIGIINHRETEEGALEIQFEDEASISRGIETLMKLGYKVKEKV